MSRRETSRSLLGADDRPERPAMFEALRLLDQRLGPAFPADAPPASAQPMTRAQRDALRLSGWRRR